jgi:polyribonucleotide nucleotidyltransferase
VRVGYIDGQIVINPTNAQRDLSDLDLIVAGTDSAIVMVEAGAREVDESVVLDAFDAAHAEIRRLCELQKQLRGDCGKEKLNVQYTPKFDGRKFDEIRRSGSRSACCRARTARPCSRAARRRRSSPARSAPPTISRRSRRRRRDLEALHAPLQLPAVLGRRSEVHARPGRREIGHGALAERALRR